MTKELLEDYSHICHRIERMEAVCVDTVTASSAEFPYTKHTISIGGVAEPKGTQEAVLAELRAKRREIEAWVEALPTEKEKALVELFALKNLDWSKVFRQTGHKSPDAARMAYRRVLERYL